MILIDLAGELQSKIDSLDSIHLGSMRLDLTTFEVANVVEDLILITDESLDIATPEQIKKIENSIGVIIFCMSDEAPKVLPKNLLNIIFHDETRELIELKITNIENFIRQQTILKSQLVTINHELNELMGGVENQMMRVKKSYEKMAPKRLEEFKGVKVFSKYTAGESLGGEFFDLFAVENKVFMMMSFTSSYLASSAILQLFSDLREVTEISSEVEENFLNEVKAQVKHLNETQKKNIDVQLLTCIFDINSLKVEGHIFGNFKLISTKHTHNNESTTNIMNDPSSAEFSFNLERGERIMLCSPGFLMNWQNTSPGFVIEELILDKGIKILDVLDEVFFQLKKESKTGFLKTDASSIVLEVEQNVIVKM